MRKLALIISVFLLITMNTAAFAKQTDELTDLASLVTGSDLPVDSWQVTIKEKMNKDAIRRILEKMKHKNGYKVTGTEDEKSVKYFIERIQKDGLFSETYHVVIPKDPMYQAELAIVLKGKDWNDSIAIAYINRVDAIKSTYFTNKSTKFACLTTTIDAKIESVYFFDQMKSDLQLTNIRKQTDNVTNTSVKKIVYGYTPLWEQEIKMKQPMNLQMVVQNSTQNSKRLTIGTPILINEY
ncbi:YwmB family TATA-box binding protein [Lentibacillus sp.]|uniref:YwmB family TATA-box binding protein n=1 Tax=Lentibacillus sp. TaxID=1925746 RepID=UPI002B4B6606|nr:YwmB family TATA-box binding protein [Lentibacillus sp.]HLS09925.1 YwmB family TATA-box binding protein [Lentibacillus sp.]